MKSRWLIIFILVLLILASCQSVRSEDKADQIVQSAITAHGGMDYWKSIKTLRFRKKTILLRADGSIEKDLDEIHELHQKDTLYGHIHPVDTSENYSIEFANGIGKRITSTDTTDATAAFLASHFVVNQPFKLLDPNVKITYEGKDTLENSSVVEVIKAYYGSPDDDVWWFYFDEKTYRVLATLIYHAPTYAYVVNDKIEEIDGLLWNTKRTTYRTDSLRNIQFVRAKFEYEVYSD